MVPCTPHVRPIPGSIYCNTWPTGIDRRRVGLRSLYFEFQVSPRSTARWRSRTARLEEKCRSLNMPAGACRACRVVDDRMEGETIDHATEAHEVCADLRVKGRANAGVPAFLLARRAVGAWICVATSARDGVAAWRLRFDEAKVNPLNVGIPCVAVAIVLVEFRREHHL